MTITTGTRFGPYAITRLLGKGGMGEVCLAEDTRLQRQVALKLLPSEFTMDATRLRRFELEARTASGLNHPNIITIYDIGTASTESGNTHFIATEFWPPYLRGQAYLKTEAAAEFQKILEHRGYAPLSMLYPLAHLGLARAAMLQGDTAQARKSYQEFFVLWKDADADLPVLIEAKKEYEKVK